MKKIIIIGIIIFLSSAAGGTYYFFEKSPKQNLPETQITHPSCLEDDEAVVFQYQGVRTTATSADIIIINKITGKEKFRFRVDNLPPNRGYVHELRKCNVYVMREFGWDYNRYEPLPGWSEELWKYAYDGRGEEILVFVDKDRILYDLDFRTDFSEVYIALIAGYLERIKEYATVIKEIKSMNDVFSLDYKDIINKYPDFGGIFALNEWTKDSRYFWGHLSYGANVSGFFRIERSTWKVDIFPAPKGTLGGTAFNPEYGYITYNTGPGWIGIDVVAEQVYDEWRKEGKVVELYLYNLFAKEKMLLATSAEPSWSGKPRWLSDTELEYELSTGEKKIYKIDEK